MARGRSAEAHTKVLEAAAELFVNRGITDTSMDAIAGAAGVSKATLYKHWPDKDSLCLEVLSLISGLDEKPPVFDTGNFRNDLIAQLSYEPAAERRELRERIIPHVIAYSSTHPAFGVTWRARAIAPVRRVLTTLVRRGQKLGLLTHNINIEVALALLIGPKMYQRIFIEAQGGTAVKNLEPDIVDAFLAAFAPKSKTAKD